MDAISSTSLDSTPEQPSLGRDAAFWGMTATQFLGAFNDNVFKQMILLLCTVYAIKVSAAGDTWQTVAQAAFALPFVLFSGYGGYLADLNGKRTIVVLAKVAEIVVMAAGLIVLWLLPGDSRGGLIALCCVLFLMGTQSAFFGPAKYGILPEMLHERDLPAANGIIQMTTFLAIIFGMVTAGQCVVRFRDELWMVSAICVGIAVVGTATSLLVRKTPVASPGLQFERDSLWLSHDMRKLLRSDRALLRVLLISTLFWFVGGVVLPAVNGFGEYNLKLGADRTSILASMMGIGIAVGCPAAGALSKHAVQFGLVQIGAAGIFASLCVVGASPYCGLSVPVIENVCRVALFGLGFSGGLFAVPLQVFLQARPPKDQKGQMIGSMNLLNWIGILVAAVFYGIAAALLGRGSSLIFVVIGLMILPVVWLLRKPAPSAAK